MKIFFTVLIFILLASSVYLCFVHISKPRSKYRSLIDLGIIIIILSLTTFLVWTLHPERVESFIAIGCLGLTAYGLKVFIELYSDVCKWFDRFFVKKIDDL